MPFGRKEKRSLRLEWVEKNQTCMGGGGAHTPKKILTQAPALPRWCLWTCGQAPRTHPCGKHTLREARSPPKLLQTELDRRALEPGPTGQARRLFPKPSDPRPPCCVLEGAPQIWPHFTEQTATQHRTRARWETRCRDGGGLVP